MSSKPPQKHVRVGVGVLVQDPFNPSKVFCGIRKGSHGAGSLALPGGHLEMQESWQECAAREVLEEMNLTLTDLQFCHVTNDPMPRESRHYVTIFMSSRVDPKASPQVPENMEPDKCEGWKSYSWDELQEMGRHEKGKLFGPLQRLIDDNPPAVKEFLSASSSAQTETQAS